MCLGLTLSSCWWCNITRRSRCTSSNLRIRDFTGLDELCFLGAADALLVVFHVQMYCCTLPAQLKLRSISIAAHR